MAFVRQTVRALYNPKSGLRKTIRKFDNTVDRTLMNSKQVLSLAAPALAAAGVPGGIVAGAAGALGSYERIRDAVRKG